MSAGFGFESFVDKVFCFLLVGVGVVVGEVYKPICVEDDLELCGVNVSCGVMFGDNFADVVDEFRFYAVFYEDIVCDRRAERLLEGGVGGVMFFFGFCYADVVEEGGGFYDKGVAALGKLDFLGVF